MSPLGIITPFQRAAPLVKGTPELSSDLLRGQAVDEEILSRIPRRETKKSLFSMKNPFTSKA